MNNNKVLIADDDKHIAELIKLYFEKDGFSTVVAEDGRKAVEMFKSEAPSIVILDVMMPEMDGWQVCREIRRVSNIPIIMLTAKGETFDKGRVNGYGLFHLDSECVFLDYIEDGGDILLFDGIARTVLFKAMLSGIDKAELSQNQIEKYKMLGFVQNNYKTIDSIDDFLSKCKSCGK